MEKTPKEVELTGAGKQSEGQTGRLKFASPELGVRSKRKHRSKDRRKRRGRKSGEWNYKKINIGD
jgi:hypothetical protein